MHLKESVSKHNSLKTSFKKNVFSLYQIHLLDRKKKATVPLTYYDLIYVLSPCQCWIKIIKNS